MTATIQYLEFSTQKFKIPRNLQVDRVELGPVPKSGSRPPVRAHINTKSSRTSVGSTSLKINRVDFGYRGKVQSSRASPPETIAERSGALIKSTHQPANLASSKGPARVTPSTNASAAPAAAGVPCSVCGRKFTSDRIKKHEEICKLSQNKKRKPYDSLKHRLQGTEAAGFIKQIRKLPRPGKAASAKLKPLNSTWRQKHEDFIKAIRAAKQVQEHIAAGGKLTDLPPPPPSKNPDYIQCPHCARRFNQAAADRHIPKCKDYEFNKPKRR